MVEFFKWQCDIQMLLINVLMIPTHCRNLNSFPGLTNLLRHCIIFGLILFQWKFSSLLQQYLIYIALWHLIALNKSKKHFLSLDRVASIVCCSINVQKQQKYAITSQKAALPCCFSNCTWTITHPCQTKTMAFITAFSSTKPLSKYAPGP